MATQAERVARLERRRKLRHEVSVVLTDEERLRRLEALVKAGVLHKEGDSYFTDWQSDGSDVGDALCELFNT